MKGTLTVKEIRQLAKEFVYAQKVLARRDQLADLERFLAEFVVYVSDHVTGRPQ